MRLSVTYGIHYQHAPSTKRTRELCEVGHILDMCDKQLSKNIKNVIVILSYRKVDMDEAFHYAVRSGYIETIELLLFYGSYVDAKDDCERCAIHRASEYGDTKIVKLLLSLGSNINVRNYDRRSPLHIAVMHNYIELVILLLSQGSYVSALDIYGYTPLHYAVDYNHTKIAELLLTRELYITPRLNFY